MLKDAIRADTGRVGGRTTIGSSGCELEDLGAGKGREDPAHRPGAWDGRFTSSREGWCRRTDADAITATL